MVTINCTRCGRSLIKGERCYCPPLEDRVIASSTDPRGYTEIDNPVSPSDFAAALDALILRDAPPNLEPDDITVPRVKKLARCGPEKARELIDKWAAAGEVVSVGMRRSGARTVEAWKVVR